MKRITQLTIFISLSLMTACHFQKDQTSKLKKAPPGDEQEQEQEKNLFQDKPKDKSDQNQIASPSLPGQNKNLPSFIIPPPKTTGPENDADNSFSPVEVLSRNSKEWKISHSVGRFHKRTYQSLAHGRGYKVQHCTFTLISPHHILGNSHCLDHTDDASNAFIEFGYQNSVPKESRKYYNCTEVVARDKERDICLLRCDGRPGDDWGWVELASYDALIGQETYTIHHPGASRKKYSTGINNGNKIGTHHFWSNSYIWTNTTKIAKGSSGSLTFSKSDHRAIMLNHSSSLDSSIPSMGTKSVAVLNFIEETLGLNFIEDATEGISTRFAQDLLLAAN